jgi:hypothetical protein
MRMVKTSTRSGKKLQGGADEENKEESDENGDEQ